LRLLLFIFTFALDSVQKMKIAKLVFLFVLITAWPAKAQITEQDSVAVVTTSTDSLVQEILTFSAKYLGSPYRYAASGPKAFDCSGFTSFAFRAFGYKLSHGCRQQITEGTRVDIPEMKPGDLIFFTSSRSKNNAGHVGIVVENYGNGNLRFIHASSYRRRGVCYDELTNGHYARRYITGLRVLE
jgi:cell wall-associated NlpC family hydrolase